MVAHLVGSSSSSSAARLRTAHLCGDCFTISGSVRASSAICASTAAYSSMSSLENVSQGSIVIGSGTTHGWWLDQ